MADLHSRLALPFLAEHLKSLSPLDWYTLASNNLDYEQLIELGGLIDDHNSDIEAQSHDQRLLEVLDRMLGPNLSIDNFGFRGTSLGEDYRPLGFRSNRGRVVHSVTGMRCGLPQICCLGSYPSGQVVFEQATCYRAGCETQIYVRLKCCPSKVGFTTVTPSSCSSDCLHGPFA